MIIEVLHPQRLWALLAVPILLAAYLVPVAWLSVKQHGTPFAQAEYATLLPKIEARARELAQDPLEADSRHRSAERAAISDSDGIGLRQVPHDEMMPDAAAALEGFLESNPMLAPLVPVQPDHRARPTRRGQDAHGRSSSAATMNVK